VRIPVNKKRMGQDRANTQGFKKGGQLKESELDLFMKSKIGGKKNNHQEDIVEKRKMRWEEEQRMHRGNKLNRVGVLFRLGKILKSTERERGVGWGRGINWKQTDCKKGIGGGQEGLAKGNTGKRNLKGKNQIRAQINNPKSLAWNCEGGVVGAGGIAKMSRQGLEKKTVLGEA